MDTYNTTHTYRPTWCRVILECVALTFFIVAAFCIGMVGGARNCLESPQWCEDVAR